jgi:hypothetical protein
MIALEREINEAEALMAMGLGWLYAAQLIIRKYNLRKDEALFLGAYLKKGVTCPQGAQGGGK